MIFGLQNCGALGDCCYHLAAINELAKRGEEVIVEMHQDQQSREVSVIFDGVAKVNFVENPIPKLYENKREKHAAQIILDKLGIDNVNCIPKLTLTREELDFACQYLFKYNLKKSIVLAADNLGSYDKTNVGAQYKLPPVWLIQNICSYCVSNGFIVFQFGRKEDKYFTPLTGAIPVRDLTIRQTAACFYFIRQFVGGDSGLYHLNLAVGGKSIVLHPPDNELLGYVKQGLHYTPDLWKSEQIRVKYIDFSQPNDIISYLNFNW